MNKLTYLFLSLLLISCDSDKVKKSDLVASVNGVNLSKRQLLKQIPENLDPEDSLAFIDQYIKAWTKEQVVLQKAEEILPDESKDVALRLENYRKSLLIYTYEQAYIEDRLDTLVTDAEIQEYYDLHPKEFTLKGYIIKGYFAQFPDSIDNNELNSWYRLQEPDDYINLNSFSQMHAIDYHLDTTNWIYFDKVLEKIPLENSIHKSSFIKNKKKISFDDNKVYYYLNIVDYKLEDELSPLAFETEKIKTIIINQRTLNLRKKLNEDLYNDALKKQQIILYNK